MGGRLITCLPNIMIILSYISAACIGLLAVAPPINYSIPVMINSFHWVYLVIASGLFGMFLLSKDLTLTLKILAVYLFITCFISKVPYMSFNAYILCVACFYFLLIFKKCDYKIILNMIEAVFWLQVFLTIAQMLGKDTLINFNRPGQPVFLGTVMQYMRFSSLLAVMAPFLIIKNKLYIIPVVIMAILSQSSSFGLAVIGGTCVYFSLKTYGKHFVWILVGTVVLAFGYFVLDRGSFQTAFSCGRIPVWGDVIRTWVMDTSQALPGRLTGPVAWKAIIVGHGMDTFLPLFPFFKHDANPFPQAHSAILQGLFECGLIGVSLFGIYFSILVKKLVACKKYLLIAGMSCIFINMCFAFPDRMTQTILLLVCFFAYCEQQVKDCGV